MLVMLGSDVLGDNLEPSPASCLPCQYLEVRCWTMSVHALRTL